MKTKNKRNKAVSETTPAFAQAHNGYSPPQNLRRFLSLNLNRSSSHGSSISAIGNGILSREGK